MSRPRNTRTLDIGQKCSGLPSMAQAGGKDGAGLDKALGMVAEFVGAKYE